MLDTNVLSELMRPAPSAAVLSWFSLQSPEAVYVTTVAYAEVLFGIDLLADGRRKRDLAWRTEALFLSHFGGRMLPFDQASASAFARIAARRQSAGRPISTLDAMIAAIAATHDAALATRDRDFADCGIALIDPWTAA